MGPSIDHALPCTVPCRGPEQQGPRFVDGRRGSTDVPLAGPESPVSPVSVQARSQKVSSLTIQGPCSAGCGIPSQDGVDPEGGRRRIHGSELEKEDGCLRVCGRDCDNVSAFFSSVGDWKIAYRGRKIFVFDGLGERHSWRRSRGNVWQTDGRRWLCKGNMRRDLRLVFSSKRGQVENGQEGSLGPRHTSRKGNEFDFFFLSLRQTNGPTEQDRSGSDGSLPAGERRNLAFERAIIVPTPGHVAPQFRTPQLHWPISGSRKHRSPARVAAWNVTLGRSSYKYVPTPTRPCVETTARGDEFLGARPKKPRIRCQVGHPIIYLSIVRT